MGLSDGVGNVDWKINWFVSFHERIKTIPHLTRPIKFKYIFYQLAHDFTQRSSADWLW